MKSLTIALLATAAIGMPAMAQNASPPKAAPQQQSQALQPQANQPKTQPLAQTQQNNQQQSAQNQPANNQVISPRKLSRGEVREVQTALNKDGFQVGHIDGVWGNKTMSAMRDFQQKKGIQANGQLNQQTVADLGLNGAQFAQTQQGGK